MRRSFVGVLLCLVPAFLHGEEKYPVKTRDLSPDKQWEYRYSEIEGGIAKAGTTESVLYLDENVPHPADATVVWAPDSKRFAYTASPPHASHTNYKTTTVYQLRGDEWKPVDPISDEDSHVPQVTQLAKDQLPKSKAAQRVWKSSPISDVVRAVKWTDADTLVISAHGSWERGRPPNYVAFLLTLKFNAEGKWKIVKSENVTDKKEDDE
jgi:hypothetical protein